MQAYIFVEELKISGKHGCNTEEHTYEQIFIINCKVAFNPLRSFISDDLDDVICYAKVTDIITKWIKGDSFHLIETLTYKMVKDIYSNFIEAEQIELSIKKPNAPINDDFKAVGFKLKSERKDFIL